MFKKFVCIILLAVVASGCEHKYEVIAVDVVKSVEVQTSQDWVNGVTVISTITTELGYVWVTEGTSHMIIEGCMVEVRLTGFMLYMTRNDTIKKQTADKEQ